jgi:hypothetical protein
MTPFVGAFFLPAPPRTLHTVDGACARPHPRANAPA